MALSFVGLKPGAMRTYQWLGDEACDTAKSDVATWLGEGTGLVPLEGQKLTTFHCTPLDPTTLQLVLNRAFGRSGLPGATQDDLTALNAANMPALWRMAVAFGVTSVEEGPPLVRVWDAGVMRLSDEAMGYLDRLTVTHDGAALRLVPHLGVFILGDSMPKESEKKG